MAKQELTSDEMYGIAKKFNREMEEFPLHTHSAITELIRCGMQHRQLAMKAEAQEQQIAQENRVLAIREHEMEQVRKRQEADSADAMRPT